MPPVAATDQYARAIEATGRLLTTLRLDFMFVGSVARAAWLGGIVGAGSIDVVAILQPQQKSQVAMMAANQGFDADREEIEATEELDLVPLRFDGVRVHILVASNALYARMVSEAWAEHIADHEWRVPSLEDLALLVAMADEQETLRRITELPAFDRRLFNEKVTSIGLRGLAV